MSKYDQCADDINEHILKAESELIKAGRLIRVLRRMMEQEDKEMLGVVYSFYAVDRLDKAVEYAQATNYESEQILKDMDSLENWLNGKE